MNNECVCCGAIIPEGGQYCPNCGSGEKTSNNAVSLSEKEIANICLECPLPSSKCKTTICKRFDEEMKRLIEEKKNGRTEV